MYDSFYKFVAKPFQLSPDPKFFFGSSVHRRALAYLKYGLEQGEGFIVITGEIGAGKTTLVRTLLEDVSKRNITAIQLVSTQLEAEDLLRHIATAFDVQSDGASKAQLLRNIEVFLKYQAAQGRRVVLLVDEAQNLPQRSLEELRMLSNFQYSDKPLLQSFLIGQPEFRQVLDRPENEQLKQRVIATYHLGPMGISEIRGYIEHRLKCVGWKGDPGLNDSAYEAIFKFTDGIPRKINVLCDRLMLYSSLERLHEIEGSTVEAVQKEMIGSLSPAKPVVMGDATGQSGQASGAMTTDPTRYDTLELLERRVLSLEQQILSLDKAVRREFAMLRRLLLSSETVRQTTSADKVQDKQDQA